MLSGDPVRAAEIAISDKYFRYLVISTLVLFVGAIMEEVDPFKRVPTHNVNVRTRVRARRKWVWWGKKTYHWLAVSMVIGGIGFEGIFEYLSANAETEVRNHDELIIALQGTRSTLLMANRKMLEAALKPFSGQKIAVVYETILDPMNPVQPPVQPVDRDAPFIAMFLSRSLTEWGWNVSPAMLSGVHGTGILIEVSPKASASTQKSALALASALVKVPVQVSIVPDPYRPVAPQPAIFVGNDAKGLATIPPYDDETIVVNVLSHP